MSKLNYHYASKTLNYNGSLDYAPAILKVVTHHHNEWDEPVFDPETGEETGETIHRVADWDTYETKTNPTDTDYRQMDYIPVEDKYPSAPAREGYHYESKRWEVQGEEGHEKMTRVYEEVEDSPPTLADFDAAMERHLTEERSERCYTTREPDSYLSSSVARWAQDARDWVAHRDEVMEYALTLINEVESGQRNIPTMEEFCAGLPKIEWTYVGE